VETPPSKPTLALSPPPSFFRDVDEGDSAHGGGTRVRSTLQAHLRVLGSSRTPSRYSRSPSRSGVKRSFHPHSHNVFASDAV